MAADAQQILTALRRARERILELEQRVAEPIAVVGRACRFAGAPDPESLWKLCVEGRSSVRPVPPERWWGPRPADPTFLAHGAWLDDLARFDAEAFGISAAEAAGIDPQQRMLLELSAEALERAGHDRKALGGSATGVFLGICHNDYAERFLSRNPDRNDAWMGTGNAFSIASGRVAYALGLTGPAVTVDTACSSSLYAVHLACQSLRARESDLAVAGGASVILLPAPSVFFGRVGFLSPSGACRPFDARADGYVRGEGAGVVVLRRLSDAEAAGDPILAVVRGSAANQNGLRNGLVAPNRGAQEAVIRAALAAGKVAPEEVGYVEAMGVASPLADLVEAAAIGAAYAGDRVLPIGSAKANVGHCEGAAGIASLLRAVEAVRVGVVPPTAGHREAPPELRAARVRVPVEPEPWAGPRLAGVSAFAFSGTNVHVVIGEAPAPGPAGRRAEPPARRWGGRAHWTDVEPPGAAAAPRPRAAASAPKDVASLTGLFAAEVASILGRAVDSGAPLATLGLDSLAVVELIRRVQERTGLQIYPADVLDAPSLAGLAAMLLAPRPAGEDRAAFLAACEKLAGGDPLPEREAQVSVGRPPVFLLSAPRAGSTLLRVLLGGHPAIFAPPELHLLRFPDLRARRERLGPQMLHLGLEQALIGLGSSAEAARATTEAWEREAAPVQAAYEALLASGRVLVDKSPSYAFDPAVLRRAERMFAGARYVLLQRHPDPVRASFARLRMGRLFDLPSGLPEGEAAWAVAARHLRAFAATIDPARVHHVRHEDLLRDPEGELRALAAFLGLPFDPAMLSPWEGDARRMTGDLGFIGDPGFHKRPRLDPTLGSPFAASAPPLQPETARLAWEEGYLPDARTEALTRAAGMPVSLGVVHPPDPPYRDRQGAAPARAQRPADAPTLLTGATGFLGPWLLRALLRRLPGTVLVLVRAPDDAAARDRVRSALRAVGASSFEGRVRALRADLAAADLGLPPETRAELVATVGRVVHAGAQVNFVQPWEVLAPANVGGTREVLRLCEASGAALLHVSTKGVYGAGMWPGDGEIPEEAPVPPPYRAASGYQESKWAAEALVTAAARDGIRAGWARVGRVGGDTRTGRAPDDDLFVRFTRACLEVSCVPDLPGAFEILPVDTVADALADLAAEGTTGPLHLVHPSPVPIAALAAALPGAELPILPYPAWRERILDRTRGRLPVALEPLLSLFPPEAPARVDDARLVPRRLLARGFAADPVPAQMARMVAAVRAE
jgi:thioester reductase-like protein